MEHGIAGNLLPKIMDNIRIEKKAERLRMTRGMVEEKSSIIIDKILSEDLLKKADKIAAFSSFQNEPRTRKIIESLWLKNKSVFLPIINEGSMNFFSYTSQTPIIENVFGIEEPDLSYAKSVSVESLDLILVPLVAFDKDCNRIGMGEGYYDKALSDLNNSNKKRTHLMGVAYNFQKVEQIKPNKWDVPLDCIVTEIDVYRS